MIVGSDVNHIRNVLRMKAGEEISVSNGEDGREYRCAVKEFLEGGVLCELRFIKEDGVELPVRVTLFQSLPKGDKMELIVQKAVELGVYEIVPVASKRCVVKLDGKKADARTARWQGIAEAAAKQSRRGILPKVSPVTGFERAVERAGEMDVRVIPYELAEGMERTREIFGSVRPGQRVAVFIGPEGGFEESEIALAQREGIVPVTLGRRILRTETAGITALAWLGYLLEQ